MATVNISQIISELNISSRKQLETLARGAAISKFNKEKKEFIKEFENSGPSKELKAGPDASSNYLSRGNLFSALGFDVGTDPVEGLAGFLEDNINFTNSATVKTQVIPRELKFKYEFNPNLLTLQAIKDSKEAKTTWSNRNFIDEIEEGISYIALYVFSRKAFKNVEASRSKTGLQREKTTEPITFTPPTSYLTQLYNKFIENLR